MLASAIDRPAMLHRMERRLLGNVKYYTDYCLTHTDADYMRDVYGMVPGQGDNYFVATYPQQCAGWLVGWVLSILEPCAQIAPVTASGLAYASASAAENPAGLCVDLCIGTVTRSAYTVWHAQMTGLCCCDQWQGQGGW
jgi:hypothetical protein